MKNKKIFIITAAVVVLIAAGTLFVLFILPKIKKHTVESNLQGLKKFASGDYNGAIEDFNKAIEFDPKLAKAYYNRGKAKFALGDNNGAIEDFNKAIEFDPKHAIAYYDRGKVKSALGDKTGATEDYNKTIEINPSLQSAIDKARNNIVVQKPTGSEQKPTGGGQKPAGGEQPSAGLSMAQESSETPTKATKKTEEVKFSKAPLKDEIDSWYKITSDKDEHIGWGGEKITKQKPSPGNKQGGFSYTDTYEYSIGGNSTFVTTKATFDNSFKVTVFDAIFSSNGEQISCKMIDDKKGRRIEVVHSDESVEVIPIDDKEEIYPSIETALYSLTQRNLLDKEGIKEVKACSPSSQGNIITIKMDVGKPERRKILGKDYVVRPINVLGGLNCYIDRYGRMVEIILPNKIKGALAENELDAKGKFGEIAQRGRRNPFVKPVIKEEATQKVIELKVTELNKQSLIEQVELALKEMTEKRDNKDEFEGAYTKLTTLYKALFKSGLLKENELKRINMSRGKAEKLYPKAEKTYGFAEDVYSDMGKGFKGEDYKGVGEQFKKLQDILNYPEIYGSTFEEDAKDLLANAGKLADRASDRLYIASKNFNVSGVFYYVQDVIDKDALTKVSNSYAIIDGKSYKEGTVVDDKGIFVKKIEKSDVIMGYKEEEIVVSIKRTAEGGGAASEK